MIVKRDAYKIRSLILLPDVVFDIGANIGVFTHCAHAMFPKATIVSVEPHPANFAALREHAPEDRTVLVNRAIGVGQMRRYPDTNRGGDQISSGEGYFSSAFGYRPPDLGDHPVEDASVESVLLDDLYAQYVKPGQRFAVKIDCEGAENLLFAHPPSVEVLQRADFVTMELHPYWMMGLEAGHGDPAKALANDKAIADCAYVLLGATHRCDSEPPMFYAWRKPDDEPIASRAEFGRLLAERGVLGNAAEIGVATGNYSRDILNWGVRHILMVDPWRELAAGPCGISDERHEANYQETLAKIAKCDDWKNRTTILRMTSVEAASKTPDESLDFCYIDANHRYEGISVDLPAWWPKLRSGGILAGHDYLAPGLGVHRAVTEFAAERGLHVHLVIEHHNDASFWIEKP
jgi:FkbM family methyltransferase